MSVPAGKDKFMAMQPQSAAALLWLADAKVLANDKAGPWVQALRATGAETFSRHGLPSPGQENWQYTNLRPLAAQQFSYAQDPVKFDAAKLPAPLIDGGYRIVLVNGQFQEKLSTVPEHVTVTSLMDAATHRLAAVEDYIVRVGDLAEAPFVALNSAYLRDGFVLQVAPHKDVAAPVEVLFYSLGGDAAIHPRVVYQIGQNAGLTVLERHMGEGVYFANSYVSVGQEKDSRFKLFRFMEEAETAWHFSQTAVSQGRSSTFEGFSLATGARTAREEFRLQLLDTSISASIGGTYLMRGQQSHDFTILADHFEPDGTSVQHFKGVIDDQARAIFQGKIHVRRTAQKTDGYQSHHAILLSDRAEASAKPELEIYADDVKCSHGATAGQLDAEALFYLRSRGIPAAEARSLIIESFLNEAIEKVSNETVREFYRARISKWLAGRAA